MDFIGENTHLLPRTASKLAKKRLFGVRMSAILRYAEQVSGDAESSIFDRLLTPDRETKQALFAIIPDISLGYCDFDG